MYRNTHLPVMSLPKAPVLTGGLCSIRFCKWEDVLTWPEIDAETGIMTTSIELREGAVLYYCTAIDQIRSFEEQQKESAAGSFFEIAVKGNILGSNAANTLSIQKMIGHQWVLIVADRNLVTRLIGNADSGARLTHNYTSGTLTESRKTELTWKWAHPLTAPIYSGVSFNITIGGITMTAGCLRLLLRFKVGAAGAPMNNADTLLINATLLNKNLLIIADGLIIPIDDLTGAIDWTGSIQRRVEKAYGSNTAEFIGGVVQDEIIQVYEIS